MLISHVEITGSIALAVVSVVRGLRVKCKEVYFDIIIGTMAAFIYLPSYLLRPVSISGCTSSESSYIWLAIKLVLPPLDA